MAQLDVSAIDLYYGAAQALRGVSVTSELGKVTAVLGRNGVGKTSLLRAITGQQPVSSGDIKFGGMSINALPSFERARLGIGFVPQGREIFPLLTVRDLPPCQEDSARFLILSSTCFRSWPIWNPAGAEISQADSNSNWQLGALW